MNVIVNTLMLWSVLVPSKMWYAPSQAIAINVKPAEGAVTLVLTDFAGHEIKAAAPVEIKQEKGINLREIFPAVSEPGTYVLWAVPAGKTGIADFTGTPLVIESRADKRAMAPPGALVTRVEPLRYIAMTTDQGDITMAFYYDVAPNTVTNFLTLAEQGYYDGLTFHRIVPGFVIQGGDPRGDGTGSPGYEVPEEFNNKKHLPGVLSMARGGDPNSAGSQFFVCLDYENTQHLDHKYTAFGTVVDGMDVVKKIAATPLSDPAAGTPAKPPVMTKVEVKTVQPGHNPYAAVMGK